MATTVPTHGRFRVGPPVAKSADDESLARRQDVQARRRAALVLRAESALGLFSSRSGPLSTVAVLVILALVLEWLAQALGWSTATLVELHSHGVTSYKVESGGSSLPAWMSYVALAIFVWAGGLGALQLRRPRLPRLIPFLLGSMLAYGTFWVIVGFEPAEYKYAFGSIGPLTFVMCLGVYAGLDLTLGHRLRHIVLALAYASITLGAYYTIHLSVNGVFEGPTPMNQHMQTAFWFGLCALALRKTSRWRDCLPALIPIALCIPIAIVLCSRSFTLLTILGLLTGLTIPLQRHLRSMAVRVLALGFSTTIVFGGGLWLLSLAAPERVLALKNRLGEDTRTSQYSQFFQQLDPVRLIPGLGPKATYTFNDWSDYDYIDNQFLFILFKFGLPVLVGYCAVVIWPGLCMLVKAADQRERSLGVFFAFWTLATLGVSIFHAITNNPQNLIAILLAGRCFGLLALRGNAPPTSQKPSRFAWPVNLHQRVRKSVLSETDTANEPHMILQIAP